MVALLQDGRLRSVGFMDLEIIQNGNWNRWVPYLKGLTIVPKNEK